MYARRAVPYRSASRWFAGVVDSLRSVFALFVVPLQPFGPTKEDLRAIVLEFSATVHATTSDICDALLLLSFSAES